MTKPEIMLWECLRKRPSGLKFRRQHPIGPYVLDFYCPSFHVAIEIYGMAHEMGCNSTRDAERDGWLARHGIDTLRLPATFVLRDLDAALVAVLHRCASPLHQPSAGPPPHASHGED